jgi:tetratricopeptide (TPR) repeat protein
LVLINSNYFKTNDDDDIKTPLKIEEATAAIANEEKILEPAQIATDVDVPKNIEPAPVLKTIEEPPAEQKVLLSPSMNFIKNIQHGTIPSNSVAVYKNQAPAPTRHQSAPAPEFIEETVLAQPIEIEEKKVREEITKVNTINIKRQNEYSDIEEIITRFKKNNNPALSLFIAKKYYELGEYRNAYNYSLITNELNKDIEASWIIFAKSLAKLNKKDEAIKVLKDYVKYSNSNRANLLLDEIQSGKFK